jgi:hypothetical protein
MITIKDLCNTQDNLILTTLTFLWILLYFFKKIQNYIKTEKNSRYKHRRRNFKILKKQFIYLRLKYTRYLYLIFILSMWNDWIYLGDVCISFPKVFIDHQIYQPAERKFCWIFTQFALQANWSNLPWETWIMLSIMFLVAFLIIFVYYDITKLETRYFYNVFWCATNWLRHMFVGATAYQFDVYRLFWIRRHTVYIIIITLMILLFILIKFKILTKYEKIFTKINQIFTLFNLIHWFILGLYSILFTYYAPFWPNFFQIY